MSRNRVSGLLGLMVACFVSGCASHTAFDTTFPVNREDELKAVLARAKATPRAAAQPVVVGVSAQPRGVFAYDLAGQRLLFKQAAEVTGVPLAAGPFAVVPEAGRVRVRLLETGAVVHDIDAQGMHLIGADSDGKLTAITLSTGGSMGARSRLVLLDGNKVSTERSVDRLLGGPAVLGGLVFVPHNRVHLSVLDASGTELTRVRIREDVASQALVHDGDVYFGLVGLYRFDEKTPLGAGGGATYLKLARDEKLPGQPAFLPNHGEPPPAVDSAVHRVSVSFLPSRQGTDLGLEDDTLYLLFYRQLYALDPQAPRARWVHQTQTDAVGVRSVPGGVFVVEDSGIVTYLDSAGRVGLTADMGVKPVVARVRADGFSASTPTSEPAPLSLQLVDAALHPDTRLVPARAMAVSMLAELPDDDATTALIEICQDRTAPERVRKVACVALSRRTTGSAAIDAALARHANYLTQTKAPPVGPLAEAALHTGDARVVPHLLAQLKDPETPVDELAALMLALKGLAGPDAAAPIDAFLRLYHADADDSRMADALVIAIDTLVRLEGARAQGTLESLANDSFTEASVRSAAARGLASLAAKAAQPEATANGEASQAAAPAEEAGPVEDPGPPAHRTAEHLERALLKVRPQLSACVRNDPKHPSSARMSIVLGGDGEVLAVETLPASVKACIQPLVLSVPFPANKYGARETLTYTISR